MTDFVLTDRGGTETFRGRSAGGSQPVKVVRFPFAFGTVGLATGVVCYTPAAGEILLGGASCLSITTAFNGTPALDLGDAADGRALIFGAVPNAANTAAGAHRSLPITLQGLGAMGEDATMLFEDSEPLLLAVNDGTPGQPSGATAGEGELVLVILAAA